jgi:hypothetical protein
MTIPKTIAAKKAIKLLCFVISPSPLRTLMDGLESVYGKTSYWSSPRRFNHWRTRAVSSISALLRQLPCLGGYKFRIFCSSDVHLRVQRFRKEKKAYECRDYPSVTRLLLYPDVEFCLVSPCGQTLHLWENQLLKLFTLIFCFQWRNFFTKRIVS